jgi:hypothetical protein
LPQPFERRVLAGRPFVRQHVADEADARDRTDVGLRQTPSDQEIAAQALFEHAKRVIHLAAQTAAPLRPLPFGRALALVLDGHRFLGGDHGQRHRLLHLPPFAAATRRQRRKAAFDCQFIKVVELIGALVELFAIRQRQHRHLEQRIERAHGVHVPEHRKRDMRVGNAVELHRDRHPAHEG